MNHPNLTTDELIETVCALLECSFAARQAARDRNATEAQSRRHAERARLLLAALNKIKAANAELPRAALGLVSGGAR